VDCRFSKQQKGYVMFAIDKNPELNNELHLTLGPEKYNRDLTCATALDWEFGDNVVNWAKGVFFVFFFLFFFLSCLFLTFLSFMMLTNLKMKVVAQYNAHGAKSVQLDAADSEHIESEDSSSVPQQRRVVAIVRNVGSDRFLAPDASLQRTTSGSKSKSGTASSNDDVSSAGPAPSGSSLFTEDFGPQSEDPEGGVSTPKKTQNRRRGERKARSNKNSNQSGTGRKRARTMRPKGDDDNDDNNDDDTPELGDHSDDSDVEEASVVRQIIKPKKRRTNNNKKKKQKQKQQQGFNITNVRKKSSLKSEFVFVGVIVLCVFRFAG
jgi:hypothetical protein